MLSHVWSFETLWSARLLCPWNFLGENTGVGCHSLLQGIFQTQGSNPGLLHCRPDTLPSEPSGKSIKTSPSRKSKTTYISTGLKMCSWPRGSSVIIWLVRWAGIWIYSQRGSEWKLKFSLYYVHCTGKINPNLWTQIQVTFCKCSSRKAWCPTAK